MCFFISLLFLLFCSLRRAIYHEHHIHTHSIENKLGEEACMRACTCNRTQLGESPTKWYDKTIICKEKVKDISPSHAFLLLKKNISNGQPRTIQKEIAPPVRQRPRCVNVHMGMCAWTIPSWLYDKRVKVIIVKIAPKKQKHTQTATVANN